jgi:hypothetical protein
MAVMRSAWGGPGLVSDNPAQTPTIRTVAFARHFCAASFPLSSYQQYSK